MGIWDNRQIATADFTADRYEPHSRIVHLPYFSLKNGGFLNPRIWEL